MKEILILLLLSGLVFVIFLGCFILGFYKKNKPLKLMALLMFFVLIGLGWWTSYRLMNNTYHK